MRKSSLPLIVLSVVTLSGLAYALVPSLFPDTPSFPRVPTAPGTIGGLLSKVLGTSDLGNYASDGTITNTEKLDGISATGYLRTQTACSAGQKWVGIDAAGVPICNSSTPLLADYGIIEDQGCSATVYHADNSVSSTTNAGDTLKAGDIVKTAPGCTLTITFSDFSLLRIDGDSVVSLDVGTLSSGMTMASALLENGSLWGRILTETGSYSIGTRDIVAGVRGTSVAVEVTGFSVTPYWDQNTQKWNLSTSPTPTPSTNITIVDSIYTGSTAAATISCKGKVNLTSLAAEKSYRFQPGYNCLTSPPPTPTDTPASTLFGTDPWIRKNTQNDIDYMADSVKSPSISTSKKARIDQELAASNLGSVEECAALFQGDALRASIKPPNSSKCPDIISEPNREKKYLKTACALIGQTYWSSVGAGGVADFCKEDGLIAYADYTKSMDLLLTGSSIDNNGANLSQDGNGVLITGTNYIRYPLDRLPDIRGKKMKITLTGTPPTLGTLVDFGYIGTTSYLIQKIPTGSGYRCVWNGSTSCVTINGNILTLTIPSTIKYMALGNNIDKTPSIDTPSSRPINAIFSRIEIQN